MKINLFEELENIGFEDLGNINIYTTKEEKKLQEQVVKKKSDLYEKNVECPICAKENKIKTVKKGASQILKIDTDFMVQYTGVNPIFYEIIICDSCGYAAHYKYFNKIAQYQMIKIVKNITPKWKKRDYPEEYDVDIAIQQFKLALYNSIVKEAKESEKAFLCLKLSWLYRLKGDTVSEGVFQKNALEGLEQSYQSEDFPIIGLDKYNFIYLMGELYRRIGENDKALKYFSEVLVSKAPDKLKDRIRDQRDLIIIALKEQDKLKNS